MRSVAGIPVARASSSGEDSVRSWRLRLFAVWVMVVLLVHSPVLRAQSTFGSIRGIAQDPAGLAVARARITIHSLDENTDRNVIADDTGGFAVENLKPGLYLLTASKLGFQDAVLSQVKLQQQQILREDKASGCPQAPLG
jgi:Carboxypeptidase regulatory-like domain